MFHRLVVHVNRDGALTTRDEWVSAEEQTAATLATRSRGQGIKPPLELPIQLCDQPNYTGNELDLYGPAYGPTAISLAALTRWICSRGNCFPMSWLDAVRSFNAETQSGCLDEDTIDCGSGLSSGRSRLGPRLDDGHDGVCWWGFPPSPLAFVLLD